MNINGFELVNSDKVERAINGTVSSKGAMVGGVGEAAVPEAILAEYDRLGGLIKKGGDKVKTGSFFDFKAKAPRDVPEVVFIYNVNGRFVEVPEGQQLPGEVRAAKMLEEEAVTEEETVEPTEEKQGKKSAKKVD